VPIPNQEAARQIVEDMIAHQQFLSFISLLIDVNRSGFVGRKYRIPRMKDILLEVMEAGYSYDGERGVFVENAVQRRTQNWGVLMGGQSYALAFLVLDIVSNSEMVRTHDQEEMSRLYGDVRGLMQRIVEKREGRLWLWEGDGGLAAFYMGDINAAAVHSGMEILHELFLYNRLWSSLDELVAVRLSAHSGQVEYRDTLESIEGPVLEKAQRMEAKVAAPDELAISEMVYDAMDPRIAKWFREDPAGDESYYRYAVEFEG
jgi:class 3 adenylate cyclase